MLASGGGCLLTLLDLWSHPWLDYCGHPVYPALHRFVALLLSRSLKFYLTLFQFLSLSVILSLAGGNEPGARGWHSVRRLQAGQ